MLDPSGRSRQAIERLSGLIRSTRWGVELMAEDIEVLSRHMLLHEYRAGEYIFREGDKEDYLALLALGEISILKESSASRESVIVTLPQGSHFGEMSLIDSEPRSATAQAKTKVALLVLGRENFEYILENNPHTGLRMLRRIATMVSLRLRETTGRMLFPG